MEYYVLFHNNLLINKDLGIPQFVNCIAIKLKYFYEVKA